MRWASVGFEGIGRARDAIVAGRTTFTLSMSAAITHWAAQSSQWFCECFCSHTITASWPATALYTRCSAQSCRASPRSCGSLGDPYGIVIEPGAPGAAARPSWIRLFQWSAWWAMRRTPAGCRIALYSSATTLFSFGFWAATAVQLELFDVPNPFVAKYRGSPL